MKAIVYSNYGSPDVLRYIDTEVPEVGENDVLVKIRAASVNPYDWHFMRGTPYFLRLLTGVRRPSRSSLGVDFAGQVEAVGVSVTQFHPGDTLFGSCRGAFAECACVPESKVVAVPDSVTFEQAASLPIAGVTALQALRDKGQVQPGQRVLINGAAGGVGTFAVQIAKSFSAEVTGVCSSRNVELVRSIGADHVIDYERVNFTRGTQRYDLIFDVVGNHSLSALRRVLTPNGICVMAGGTNSRWNVGLTQMIIAVLWSSLSSKKLIPMLAKLKREDLATLADLVRSGKLKPVIERRYRLEEVPEAIRYLETGHARGKVIIATDETSMSV